MKTVPFQTLNNRQIRVMIAERLETNWVKNHSCSRLLPLSNFQAVVHWWRTQKNAIILQHWAGRHYSLGNAKWLRFVSLRTRNGGPEHVKLSRSAEEFFVLLLTCTCLDSNNQWQRSVCMGLGVFKNLQAWAERLTIWEESSVTKRQRCSNNSNLLLKNFCILSKGWLIISIARN